MSILQDDLQIKLKGDVARKPIGYVMRGGFSQARGHGMAFGVICQADVQLLVDINSAGLLENVKKQTGKIVLFRRPNSLMYQPCWLFN